MVLGKKGQTVTQLRAETGAAIKVLPADGLSSEWGAEQGQGHGQGQGRAPDAAWLRLALPTALLPCSSCAGWDFFPLPASLPAWREWRRERGEARGRAAVPPLSALLLAAWLP